MGIIVGLNSRGVGGGSQVQSDWNQTDNTQPDYIKNKPNISGGYQLNILTTELNLEQLEDYGPTTRQGLAEYFGITEEQLQDLYDGKYNGLCGPDNIICWLTECAPNNGRTVYNCSANYGVEIYCFGANRWAKGYMFD